MFAPEQTAVEPFPEAAIERSVTERFIAVARRMSERIAVADEAETLTYAQLSEWAGSIAARVERACASDGPVAVLLPHRACAAAAVLGVLAARRGCLPLDPDHPIERLRMIAAHAGAAAVVASAPQATRVAELFSRGLPVIDADEARDATGRITAPWSSADDLSAIIYTSGSTGVPKGVYQNHRGLLQDVMTSVNLLQIGPADRLAVFYSLSLIAGLKNLFNAVLTGASAHFLPLAQLGPANVAAEIRRRGLTIVSSAPGVFRHIAGTLENSNRFDDVRLVLFGGDRSEWADVDAFATACGPGARLGIHLSSTECWAIQTHWFVDPALRRESPRPPVGAGVAGRAVSVVDDDGNAVPDGVVGECVVRSRYIALGYWRDPELTGRAFRADPDDPAARVFHTGDLVMRRPDGLFEYIGRKDDQVKIAGRRVELGEIEAALKRCAGVRDAAVVVHTDGDSGQRSLVAYVERAPDCGGLLPRHLKSMLSRYLPRLMVPPTIELLDSLPRLPTFKVDRAALAARTPHRVDTEDMAEFGPLAGLIACIVAETLERPNVTPSDNFIVLGGDSLQAVKVATRLERSFGIRIPVDAFDRVETIGELARWSPRGPGPRDRAQKGTWLHRPRARQQKAKPPTLAEVSEWTSRIETLVQQDELEAACRELEALASTRPDVPYGARLRALVTSAPPRNPARSRFVDDPAADVQINRCEGAKTVALFFCGIRHALGLSLSLVHRWIGALPVTVVYLRDRRNAHYFGGIQPLGDRAASLAALRRLRTELGAERLVCAGNSAGSIAALHYGLDLGADATLSLAGPLDFSSRFNSYGRAAWLAGALRERFPGAIPDLCADYASVASPPETLLAYGDNSWDDRMHAEALAHLPRVRLLQLEGSRHHNVVAELIRREWFTPVLQWLLDPTRALPARVPAVPAGQLIGDGEGRRGDALSIGSSG